MAEMTVRRVGVFSLAKIEGLLMFVMGLIIGVLYGLFFMIFGAAIMANMPRGDQAFGGVSTIVGGLVIMITMPIMYGVLGFIFGAIAGLIYNLAAGVVGGIKLELEPTSQYAAPPPPYPYQAN